jgi:hypothetical protein
MQSAPRSVVIGTRTSSETKARFAALAARQGLSESAFLGLLIDKVLAANVGSEAANAAEKEGDPGFAKDRLTLRLRPGDRALADAKAAARRMKTASYLAMLVRTHVRGSPVMPPSELDQLKATTSHLAALGRQLRLFGTPNIAASLGEARWHDLLATLRSEVEAVRERTAAVIRQNLISWEAGNA